MKVSVITIVYNNKACIADCICSVLSQSYPDIEHIVIDGGSIDGTQEQIALFKDKLAYYVSENDKGLYDALNKGIRHATGDIIGILHSDDLYYEPETIRKVVDAFQQSEADLVYANGQYISAGGDLQPVSTKQEAEGEKSGLQVRVSDVRNEVKRIYRARPFKKQYLMFGWIPLHTTIYVRRELFQKYGLYDTQYQIASDYEISLRWFFNETIKKVYLNEWVVKMRLGGKSTSASLQKKKSTEDLVIIRQYHLWGVVTLAGKIVWKIPQYLLPKIVTYK